MNPKVIVIDGKTYNSVDEMPPDVRQKYEQAMRSLGGANNNRIPDVFETANIFADKDGNGVPDVLENMLAGNAVMNSLKIIVDGKEFKSIADLPPEARARYEAAMGKLDANRNGIPDFAEGMINTTKQTTNISTSFATETPARPIGLPTSSTIEPDTSNGWKLMVTGLLAFLFCVAIAGGVWYFFLR